MIRYYKYDWPLDVELTRPISNYCGVCSDSWQSESRLVLCWPFTTGCVACVLAVWHVCWRSSVCVGCVACVLAVCVCRLCVVCQRCVACVTQQRVSCSLGVDTSSRRCAPIIIIFLQFFISYNCSIDT